MSDLNELFKVLAEGKKHYEENDPKGKKLKEVKEHVKVDLNDIFSQLVSVKKQLEEQLETIEAQQVITEYREPSKAELNTTIIPQDIELPTPEERSVGIKYDVDRYLKTASFQQPDPDTVSPDVNDIRAKIKFLEQAIGRIAATGPGGGEVNLRWLDDVDRSTIYDMRYLRYNNTKKKFEFAEVNPHDIVYSTTLVTTSTYTVTDEDYYIGINYAGPTTITLPSTPSSGRMIIIKDESGNAETNPISVHGTVDNDAGGFIIQINNGAIQLLYRDGWRIV